MKIAALKNELDGALKALKGLAERVARLEQAGRNDPRPVKEDLRSKGPEKSTGKIAELRSQLQKHLPKLRLPARLLWEGVSLIVILLTLVTGYVQLRYEISVSYYASLNQKLPFESRFLVTNQSPFPIYNVRYFCGSAHVRINGGREITNKTWVPIPVGELRARGAYTVRCQHPLGEAHIDPGAFLEIHVLYIPKFLPWIHKEGGQQFVLKYDQDGNSVWLPTPDFTKSASELEGEAMNP